MISMPVSSAYVADLAPPEKRGLYMGTYGLVWSVAFICGPTLGMTLFGLSPLALWTLCGLMGLLAAAIILHEPQPRPADRERKAVSPLTAEATQPVP